MVWVCESDGSCTYLSASWCEFTGQTEQEGLGFGWVNSVHPDDRAGVKAIFLAANARREPFRLEYRLRRKDGVYRWALDAAAPWIDEAEIFRGYIGSVMDITDRKPWKSSCATSETATGGRRRSARQS